LAKHSVGVRRHGAGWQAYVRVSGTLITRSFPLQTPPAVMQAWRAGERLIAQRQGRRDRPTRGSLAGDVTDYLAAHQHLPTIRERAAQLQRWVDALGGWRSRDSVSSQEIATWLSTWRVEKAWSGQTCNHYRTALASLYAWLGGENPVRAVPKARVTPPVTRALPYAVIAAILRELRPGTKAWVRLALLAYCGVPPATLRLVTPDRIDYRQRVVRLPARRKGAGAAGRLLPVTCRQLVWWRRAARLEAIGGPISTSSLWKAFRIAARKARARGVPVPEGIRPYDLRHSFGALVYRETGDLATTARLLGHATTTTAERYTSAAFASLDAEAMSKVGTRQGRKLPATVASGSESSKSLARP
jgi:integrase